MKSCRVEFAGGAENGPAGMIGPAAQIHGRHRPARPFAGGTRQIEFLHGAGHDVGSERGLPDRPDGKSPRLRLRERGRLGPAIDHVGRRFEACREIGRRPRQIDPKRLQVGDEFCKRRACHRLNPCSRTRTFGHAGAPTAFPIDTSMFRYRKCDFRYRAGLPTHVFGTARQGVPDANSASMAARSPIPCQPLPRCALMAAVALAKRAASSGARPSLRASA